MVEISIQGDRIHLEVKGLDKLWAFKSQLDFPLEHIKSVRQDPEPARGWWHGVRLPGVQIPGLLTAGTFFQYEGAVFYDVHDPDKTIVLELEHEEYCRLVVEVVDPATAVDTIRAAIAQRPLPPEAA